MYSFHPPLLEDGRVSQHSSPLQGSQAESSHLISSGSQFMLNRAENHLVGSQAITSFPAPLLGISIGSDNPINSIILGSWDQSVSPRNLPVSSPACFSCRYVSHWRRFLRIQTWPSRSIYHFSIAGLWRIPPTSIYLLIVPLKFPSLNLLPRKKWLLFYLHGSRYSFLMSQVEFMVIQNYLVVIYLNSSNQMKWGPLFLHHFVSEWCILVLMASTLDCILVITFLILACLDFSSFISAAMNSLVPSMLFIKPR